MSRRWSSTARRNPWARRRSTATSKTRRSPAKYSSSWRATASVRRPDRRMRGLTVVASCARTASRSETTRCSRLSRARCRRYYRSRHPRNRYKNLRKPRFARDQPTLEAAALVLPTSQGPAERADRAILGPEHARRATVPLDLASQDRCRFHGGNSSIPHAPGRWFDHARFHAEPHRCNKNLPTASIASD